MMENIFCIGGNLMFYVYELYKLIFYYWLKYLGLFYIMYLILGVFVIIVGFVLVIGNGFIVWMFCR